jgi:hypothetical protein
MSDSKQQRQRGWEPSAKKSQDLKDEKKKLADEKFSVTNQGRG